MSDVGRYFWINPGNMVEFDGPFDTIGIAKKEAIEACKTVNDTMEICIVRVVEEGEVTTKFKWKSR